MNARTHSNPWVKKSWQLLIYCILLVSAILFSSYFIIRDNELRDWLNLFTLIIEDFIMILFPIVAVLVYPAPFSSEVNHRFLVYTRMRRGINETIHRRWITNFALTSLFLFFVMFSIFLITRYVEPTLGIAHYDLKGYGLSPETVAEDQYTRYTFTQLLRYGDMFYGFFYSLWVAINGALYASIAFFLVLLIRNRFLALSFPFILYLIGTFAFNSLELEKYSFMHSIFPFYRVQNSIGYAFIPFFVIVCINILLFILLRRSLKTAGNLT